MIKKKIIEIYNFFDKKKWNIGFFDYRDDFFFSDSKINIKILKHNYKDKWFADPFILHLSKDKVYLLVEEFDCKIKKGRIAKLIINRKSFELESLEIILEKKSHLSFPAIFVDNENEIFVYPENSQSGSLTKYRYNKQTNKLEKPDVIIDQPLVDAVFLNFNQKKYLFCTTKDNSNGSLLTVYIKHKKTYKLFDTIKLSENIARGAGDFIHLNDRVIRPTQDCNNSYGNGIVFQELVMKDKKFIFKNIKRIYSNVYRYKLGLHTFNYKKNLAVVDVLGYKYFLLGNMLNIIRHIYIKLIGN